ncbi:MAG: DUF2752 domain-containing protein [Candidatus Nanopelagicales bacterium]|nr:DUF2752 domain-containing protein [Candidatus Nanopelagicales bacterium]
MGNRKPLRIDARDTIRPVTILAVVAVGIAVAMAAFGLPPVDLHSPLHYAGIMDPLCGGTRSIRLAAMGRWGESLSYNPIGLPLLILLISILARVVVGTITGKWITIPFTWTRRRIWVAVVVGVALAVILEIRQQSIAPLLLEQ